MVRDNVVQKVKIGEVSMSVSEMDELTASQ